MEIPRDVLDAKVPLERARVPNPGAYRASTKSVGDPVDIERLADILVNAERPAALNVPAFYWKLLRAEGLEPQLDACVRCGESEPDTELVAFDLNEGGVQCRRCRTG